jgi:hypothetical protein
MTAQEFVARLQGVQGKAPRWRAICPSHISKHQSRTLAVTEGRNGGVALHCFAGCPPQAICDVLGVEMSDLFPPRESTDPAERKRRDGPNPWQVFDLLDANVPFLFFCAKELANGARLSQASVERLTEFGGKLSEIRRMVNAR